MEHKAASLNRQGLLSLSLSFFLPLTHRCFHTLVRNGRSPLLVDASPPPVFRATTLKVAYTSVKIFLFMFTQFCELFCAAAGKLGCCL